MAPRETGEVFGSGAEGKQHPDAAEAAKGFVASYSFCCNGFVQREMHVGEYFFGPEFLLGV